jgi:hypothetical protein
MTTCWHIHTTGDVPLFQVRRLLLGVAVIQYLIGNYKNEYYNMLGENIDCIS